MQKKLFQTLMSILLVAGIINQVQGQTNYTTTGQYCGAIKASGNYTITIKGASGGKKGDNTFFGGTGATITGTFALNANDMLTIIVGRTGFTNTTSTNGGGGGGGTAVVLNGTTLLLAAGGGGGAGRFSGGNGGMANTAPNPAGGSSGSGSFIGGGGGGYGFAGANSAGACTMVSGGGAASLTAISAGGVGATGATTGTCNSGLGGGAGFGGGGGAQTQGGGGGGGYVGGSCTAGQSGGDGGDSYVNLIATNVTAIAGTSNAAPVAGSDGTFSINITLAGSVLATSMTTVTSTISGTTLFANQCSYVTAITPSGASPISGSVTAKTWIETAELITNSNIYTRRHYEITPTTNAATATGRVTLYALQSEFDNYNSTSTSQLPYEPTNEAGISRLRIYKYSGTSSNGTGLPDTYSGSPVVINPADADIVWNSTNNYWEISFDVTGFSGFFIGGIDAFILPVKLAGFTAARQAANSLLTWQVAQEKNIATYTIERSADGRSFTSVGSLASLGNIGTTRNYSFTDANPVKGANYYRLKIAEKDGKVSYSEVRLLNFGSQMSIALFPNPVKDKATITGIEAGMQVRLVNAAGRIIATQKAVGNTISLPIVGVATGLYQVQVYSTNGVLLSTARLVKN